MYGDSNCLDSSHRRSNCESFAISVVRYLAEGDDSMLAGMQLQEAAYGGFDGLPKRVEKVDYATVSRVMQEPLTCRSNSWMVVDDGGGDGKGDDGDGRAVPEPVVVEEVRVGDEYGPYEAYEDGDDDGNDDDVIASSPPSPRDPTHPSPHVNADVVFDANLEAGGGDGGRKYPTDFVSKEFLLAAVAFLLLFLVGCARWNRRRARRRENGGRRPGSAAERAERLPILTEGAPRSW